MPNHGSENAVDVDIRDLATDVFGTLTGQFPVCMGSDEFHFFPQARAKTVDWSHWDDFSPDAIDRIIGQLNRWDRQLEQRRRSPLSPDQTMDADMLQRVVRTLAGQMARVRTHRSQPTFYLTVVGIGLTDALTAGAPALNARLRHLPGFLDQARRNLDAIPALFRDLGVEMLVQQRNWIDALPVSDDCRKAINGAYRRLDTHLHQAPDGVDFQLPESLYEEIARDHMGCLLDPDAIARELAQEIDDTRSTLERTAISMAPGRRWQDVVDDMPRPCCAASGLVDGFQSAIDDLASHCLRIGLIDASLVQTCPVTVEPIPEYMRPVRSNAAYSMPPGSPPRGGIFFIQTGDDGNAARLPPDYRLLTAHETYPGHHLLDSCRWGHARVVRRHIEFPVFYEGWASFAEELLFDTGFFSTEADRMLMAKRRFWRAMRGQVDFDIHMRRRTLDEATVFLVTAGMAPGPARAMVRRYSLKPGYQLAYAIGRRRFRRLYESFIAREPDPVAFARRVLAQGEIGFNHLEQLLQQGGRS